MLSTIEQEGDMAMDNALTMQELGEAELLSVAGGHWIVSAVRAGAVLIAAAADSVVNGENSATSKLIVDALT